MISSFYGFQIARSAMQASQIGLDVTGQNVANAKNEDYTRQVADTVSTDYASGNSQFARSPSTNLGEGVTVKGISQTRDRFLDSQVRNANSDYGAWNAEASALTDVENIFDESTTDGLHALLGGFYTSLQNLANNVGSPEYANNVRSGAQKVAQAFNQYASQLKQVREEYSNDLSITVTDMNTTIQKLNQVNERIQEQAVGGDVSNSLLDMRNSYLDTLSGYINIKVSTNADSTVSVTSGDVDVLDSTFSVSEEGGKEKIAYTDGKGSTQNFNPISGNISSYLKALNESGGYDSKDAFRGIGYYEKSLDDFAASFANTLNQLNSVGGTNKPLFSGTTAAKISISDGWRGDPNYIVQKVNGANDNVTNMIIAMDESRTISSNFTGSFQGFSKSLMNDIAEDKGYNKDMKDMSGNILNTAKDQRKSLVGVSIDEETINMNQYQKCYQAAARFMTVLDENLDTLISNTGIVGR